MDLRPRSTRSRSKTPFRQTFSSEQTFEGGGHVEETVVRTTRRTAIHKTNDNTISSSEELITSENYKPLRSSRISNTTSRSAEKSIRGFGYKTSDYSSEEGESEVTSSKVISQNDRNQLIEDAKAATNGSTEVSALNLYRRAGRYWEKYPKTDWTYSPHSRDRVELAPGIVQMPNMSRRTIHSYCSNTEYSNKETNTDSYLDEVDYTKSRYSNSYSSEVKPQKLFSNNNYDSTYSSSRSRWLHTRNSFFSYVTSVFTSIYTTVFSWFYYVYQVEHSSLLWLGKKIHRLSSKVMLLDTWLLKKTTHADKTRALLALCLLPLLLFGGWWLLSGLGTSLYGLVSNTTQAVYESSVHFDNFIFGKSSDHGASNVIVPPLPPNINTDQSQHTETEHHKNIEEKIIKITEKIYMEPPQASEIAAGLSSEQLDYIASTVSEYVASNNKVDVDKIVEKILLSPSIQNVINNYNSININRENDKDEKINIDLVQQQQNIINNLKEEINKIKLELLEIEKLRNADLNKMYAQFETENAKNAHFLYQLNRCCRRNIINIEAYVTKILTDLLKNPEFLRTHLSDWLHTMFVAKHDLELHLANTTRNLNAKFDSLIENNGRLIMDEVTGRIKLEMNEHLKKIEISKTEHKTEVNLATIGEERVKEIVKSTLAIYDADKTGLVDYAMEPMGGQVLTTRCTESYSTGTAVVSVLGIPLWYPTNSPRTVITPGIHPGECWAFQNFPGFVVIKLATSVRVEAFSLEHISKLLVPNGTIDSAPKDFEVFGLKNENDNEPTLIGTYVYDVNGEPLQYFAAHYHGLIFDTVELRITSNHGNPNYTCLYRFRVHGKLANEHT